MVDSGQSSVPRGLADLQAGAAGQNLAAEIHEGFHLLRHLEPVRVGRLALDALGWQEYPDCIALLERKDAEPKGVPYGFRVGGVDHDSDFHGVLRIQRGCFRVTVIDRPPALESGYRMVPRAASGPAAVSWPRQQSRHPCRHRIHPRLPHSAPDRLRRCTSSPARHNPRPSPRVGTLSRSTQDRRPWPWDFHQRVSAPEGEREAPSIWSPPR